MMTMLIKFSLEWMERQRKRAVLRNLLRHDDHILEDMGLRRAEIERALQLPLDADAMRHARETSRASLALDRRA
jgi:uncharacterized protein YjiS (DUF1127 family)